MIGYAEQEVLILRVYGCQGTGHRQLDGVFVTERLANSHGFHCLSSKELLSRQLSDSLPLFQLAGLRYQTTVVRELLRLCNVDAVAR